MQFHCILQLAGSCSGHHPGARYIRHCLRVSSLTVLTSGAPPKWLPPASTQRLREDSGQYYRDPNAARYSRWPLAPTVQSIYALNPDFHSDQIDICCCASILGSLLASVRGEHKTFQFGMQRIANTVFLIRKSNHPQEFIENVRGYGHTFPEAYTVWQATVKGSASHQRIVRYQFGELKCLVRSECDGYLGDRVPDEISKTLDDGGPSRTQLPDQTEMMRLNETGSTLDAGINLEVRLAGAMIPQASIFDLKTRSAFSTHTVESENFLARLWANQTPNFILAHHRRGVFDAIEVIDVRDRVKRWEKDNRATLTMLNTLLKRLSSVCNNGSMSRLEIRRTGQGKLEVWSTRHGWSALPPELQKLWSTER